MTQSSRGTDMPDPDLLSPALAHAPGLRAIIFYKAIKGAVQLILAATLFVMISAGFTHYLHDLALRLGEHATSAWSVELAALLVKVATARWLKLTCLALALDGALTTVEGWALHHRHWWGPWLVVLASGSLVPYEVYEIIRRPWAGRILLLVLNLLVVIYLAEKAWKEHRARH